MTLYPRPGGISPGYRAVPRAIIQRLGMRPSREFPSFNPVIDTAPYGLVLFSWRQGEIYWCNRSFARLLGHSPSSLRGADIRHFLNPEETRRYDRHLKRSWLSPRPGQFKLKSSKKRSLGLQIQGGLSGPSGRQIAVAKVCNPQGPCRSAMLTQNNPEPGPHQLINSIDSYLFTVGPEGGFRQVNAPALQFFRSIIPSDTSAPDNLYALLQLLSAGSQKNWEKHLRLLHQSNRPVRFHFADIFNGQLLHFAVKLEKLDQSGAIICHLSENTDQYLRHRLLKVINNFKERLPEVQSEYDLLWLATDEILAALNFEDAQIMMVEDGELVAKTAHGIKRIGRKKKVTPLRLPLGKGITGKVAVSGESHLVEDTQYEPRYISRHFIGRSEVAVPIEVNGIVAGVINCESRFARFFGPLHVALLQEVAELIGAKLKMFRDEQKLREMQMLNRAVLDSTPNSFVLLNPQLQIQSFNRTAQKVFRGIFGRAIAVNEAFTPYVPQEHASEFIQHFNRALGGKIQRAEKKWNHSAESEVWLAMTFAPARNHNGKVFGVTLIIEDISEKKQQEQLIVQQNEELKSANEELDKFVYSVSHDLRSPLSNVMGLTTIIESSEDLQETKTYSRMIAQSVHRMDDFIHNILDYSRNGRLAVTEERIFLHQLVSDLALDFHHIPTDRPVEVINDIPRECVIHSDEQRLRIILGNLLSNAIKYHDAKKMRCFVRLSAEERNGRLVIRVEDNGQGIDEKHLPHLFQMFYTAHIQPQGSGIGLYILQDAVTQLGGKVGVQSSSGKGTQFEIDLPTPKSA